MGTYLRYREPKIVKILESCSISIKMNQETLLDALAGLEKVHKLVNKNKPKLKEEEKERRVTGPIFRGDSYKRQKMGAVYWHEEGKASKPAVPIGRPGNVLGLTDA